MLPVFISCPFSVCNPCCLYLSLLMKYIRDLYRRYISCGHRLFRQQHDNDQYYRNYWQRPAFNTRNGRNGSMAKCIGAQSLLPAVWGEQQQLHDAPAIATIDDYHQPSSPAAATTATPFNTSIHYDDAQYWHIRHADNSIQPVWSSGESFDDDEPFRSVSATRRCSINAHDHLPFVSKSINEMDSKMATAIPLDRASSNQASVRGSFRSEGSGQSQVCRPFSQLSYSGSVHNRNALLNEEFMLKSNNPHHHNHHHHNYHHYHSCFSPHFYNCHDAHCYPVYPQEVLNTKVFLPNKYLEQDKLPTIDSNRLNELPVLKTIHGQSINGINRNRFQRTNLDGSLTTLRATLPISRSAIHFANRQTLSKRPKLEPVPEAIYDSTNICQGKQTKKKFYLNIQTFKLIFISQAN